MVLFLERALLKLGMFSGETGIIQGGDGEFSLAAGRSFWPTMLRRKIIMGILTACFWVFFLMSILLSSDQW